MTSGGMTPPRAAGSMMAGVQSIAKTGVARTGIGEASPAAAVETHRVGAREVVGGMAGARWITTWPVLYGYDNHLCCPRWVGRDNAVRIP